MKILKLQAQNVKRLSAVNITPEGDVVVIGGNNGAGKSSVLDSIMYALAGKSALPDEPVRKGAKKAKVVVDLGDLTVTRTITAKGGGQLVVSNGGGARLSSPQAVLDKLVGRLTFDPLAFTRQDPKRQAETLRELVGLDFAKLDERRKSLFGERTEANRESKTLQARLDGMQHHDGAPEAEVSVGELAERLEQAQATNRANLDVRAGATGAAQELATATRFHQQLLTDLENLKARIAESEKKVAAARKASDAADTKAEAVEGADIDCQPIREQMRTVEDTNRKVRENAARARVAADLVAVQERAGRLSTAIEEIDEQKASALESAEFPVEGLSFDEDGVSFDGIPLDQCSSAEQLRISVAMGIAANPELKVLLIRDGSLLDPDSLRMIAEMAEGAGAQVWIERVGDGEDVQVLIEDGHVKGADGVEADGEDDAEAVGAGEEG